MSNAFAGKSALVTGGGTGIGRESALKLASLGCFVTVVGRSRSTLEETVGAIRAAGGEAAFATCDVSDETSVQAAVTQAVSHRGRLDFCVNSAGVSGGDNVRPLADYDTAEFDRMIAIDLRGTFLVMKHCIPVMLENPGGSIVNIGSGAGVVGVPGFAGYTAAKHGLMGLTKTAALDYGARGLRVNVLVVGLVNTPLVAEGRSPEVMAARIAAHPIGRIGEPGEIADAVIWLCSDQSSFVTGAAIPVDGGYTAQ
jgi:NAD(P)-dependent dehydrogenase (short-subunit alcohol dehydrogenase family)